MKKPILLLILASIQGLLLSAQTSGVGIGTTVAHPTALLELKDSARGLLPPRLTYAQRNSIINPAQGLIIYCVDCGTRGESQVFDGVVWVNLAGGAAKGYVPLADTTVSSVIIGNQRWSTKNLDVAKYRNGDLIPKVTSPTTWASLTSGAWCWYNNDSATYAATYGRLYNWYAVNDPRGLAPQGWHVPNESEWNEMIRFLDDVTDTICEGCTQSASAGGAMKSTTGWFSPNFNASNSSGFSGLPGGYRANDGSFTKVGLNGVFWSASEYDGTAAWTRFLYYNLSDINRYNYLKKFGFSVRLVRD